LIKVRKNVFEMPIFFGVIYIANIIIFAILYWKLFPMDFKNVANLSFIQALYFSVVSVTTLGFGDITPKMENSWLIISVILQVVLGVLTIGFFLNSISHKISQSKENEINQRLVDEERIKVSKALLLLKPIINRQISTLSDIYKSTSSTSSSESYTVRPLDFWNDDYFDQVCLIDYYSMESKYGKEKMIGNVILEENEQFRRELESYLVKFSHVFSIDLITLINEIQNHRYFDYPKTSLQLYRHIMSVNRHVERRHMIANEHSARIATAKNMPLDMRNYHKKLLDLISIIDDYCPEQTVEMNISLVSHIAPKPGSAIGKLFVFGGEDPIQVDKLLDDSKAAYIG